jgi:hypothetical protein
MSSYVEQFLWLMNLCFCVTRGRAILASFGLQFLFSCCIVVERVHMCPTCCSLRHLEFYALCFCFSGKPCIVGQHPTLIYSSNYTLYSKLCADHLIRFTSQNTVPSLSISIGGPPPMAPRNFLAMILPPFQVALSRTCGRLNWYPHLVISRSWIRSLRKM